MAINEAAQRFTVLTQEIDQLLDVIRAAVMDSKANFTGSASGAFQQVMANYDADAGIINTSMRNIAEAIATSGKDFHASDEEYKSLLTQSGSGLYFS